MGFGSSKLLRRGNALICFFSLSPNGLIQEAPPLAFHALGRSANKLSQWFTATAQGNRVQPRDWFNASDFLFRRRLSSPKSYIKFSELEHSFRKFMIVCDNILCELFSLVMARIEDTHGSSSQVTITPNDAKRRQCFNSTRHSTLVAQKFSLLPSIVLIV